MRQILLVILKLTVSLTLIPFVFALFRALQQGFEESSAYGFLGIVAFLAAWAFLWFIVFPLTLLYALWIWFEWVRDEEWEM